MTSAYVPCSAGRRRRTDNDGGGGSWRRDKVQDRLQQGPRAKGPHLLKSPTTRNTSKRDALGWGWPSRRPTQPHACRRCTQRSFALGHLRYVRSGSVFFVTSHECAAVCDEHHPMQNTTSFSPPSPCRHGTAPCYFCPCLRTVGGYVVRRDRREMLVGT